MTRISIRFFDDREVRAIWDEENSKWWYSVLDIVGVLNAQDDYTKNRNYWKYLKTKLKNDGNEVVSGTNQLKLRAPDGKMRLTDVLDAAGVVELAKNMPNNKASSFIEWFIYGEDTIDGKSKAKAYTLFESSLLDSILAQTLANIGQMPESTFDEIADKYVEMNVAHPFREGNGRTMRIWLDLILKKRLGKCVDWSCIDKYAYLAAMEKSVADSSVIKKLLKEALTDKVDDREMFMKGIDYSYYYEES